MTIGPLGGGIGLRPQISGSTPLAFDGPTAVQFACGYDLLNIGTVDLSNPAAPQPLLSFQAACQRRRPMRRWYGGVYDELFGRSWLRRLLAGVRGRPAAPAMTPA